MFGRKKKSQDMTPGALPGDSRLDSMTALADSYMAFIADLALVFPGIVRGPEGEEEAYWHHIRDPLKTFQVRKVKDAADAIRASQEAAAEAERIERAQGFLKELRK